MLSQLSYSQTATQNSFRPINNPFSRTFTADETTQTLKNVISLLKKSVGWWKQSGNGKDNTDTNGDIAYHIPFKDVDYVPSFHGGDDQDNELVVKFVDDDCRKFTQQIPDLFLWVLSEYYHVTCYCTQSCDT